MAIIMAKSIEDMSKKAAVVIASQIIAKPDSVMGFATGSTPVGTYNELIQMYKDGVLDFSGITTFNLDEYFGLESTHDQSYYYFMMENLFKSVNVDKAKINIPSGTASDIQSECDAYESKIDQAGGIDLQLLGIGLNGHIGFNEPCDNFDPRTHKVDLEESTIQQNAKLFFNGNIDEVPKQAVTMGIGTIMKAKKVVLLGDKSKQDIINKAMNGPVTPQVPASILQYHPNVTVITVA